MNPKKQIQWGIRILYACVVGLLALSLAYAIGRLT